MGLGPWKRYALGWKLVPSGDEDAGGEGSFRSYVEIEEAEKGIRVGDAEVVAREDADPAPAVEEVFEVSLEKGDPAFEDEGREEVGPFGLVEVAFEVREERVVLAGDEGRSIGGRGRSIENAVAGEVSRLEVVGAGGKDVADAAPGIADVSSIARNEVDVKVGDGLASRLADVDAEVEAVGAVPGEDGLAGDGESRDELRLLLAGGVEPAGHVSSGHEKGVALARRESVPEAEDQASAVEDELRVGLAEGAGGMGQRVCRVMVRRPSRPLVTQSAQRQRLMRRRAIR